MAPRALIAVFLIGLLLQGCFSTEGVEPTDLSAIQKGVTVVEVEMLLGMPVKSKEVSGNTFATYTYDTGADDTLADAEASLSNAEVALSVATFPLYWAIKREELVKSQKGFLEVVYGPNNTLVFFRENPDRLSPVRWTLTKTRLTRQAEAGDPNSQFALALFGAPEVNQWFWLCSAAHNSQPMAQLELARYYLNGIGPFRLDPMKGLMFYKLANRAGFDVPEVRSEIEKKGFTASQIAQAERLVTEWEPNLEECAIEAAKSEN